MGDILNELAACVLETDFSNSHIDIENQDNESLSRDLRRIGMISFIFEIVNLSCLRSYQFNTLFTRHSGLEAHLAFLKDKEIFKKILDVSLLDMNQNTMGLIESIILNLASMSRNFEENSLKWTDSNAIRILLDIRQQKPTCANDVFIVIANIATDKQIEALDDIQQCIMPFVEMADKAAQDFRSQK